MDLRTIHKLNFKNQDRGGTSDIIQSLILVDLLKPELAKQKAVDRGLSIETMNKLADKAKKLSENMLQKSKSLCEE